jgi:hypothetical protein
VKTIFPDYTGLDFSQYLCPAEDLNPMFRLWSGGRWLKAYLAHGCYWHNCSFCDVTLDYIRSYEPAHTEALFRHLVCQAEKTGIRGIHLVDEAAPPAALIRFALLNLQAGLPLIFWGNIRFDRAFTPDTAALLAAGGLIGVSGGIEIASPEGFKRIGKGFGLEDLIRVSAAFKEAGVLTHGYLIYGYWDQDEQEIIDSAETLRQIFSAGLLDSAFWHQFILTRHSRIYAEHRKGQHPALNIRGDPEGEDQKIFALNDLSFEGEEKYNRYTEGLDLLLASWMGGDTSRPVTSAFPFPVKEPQVPPGLIEGFLDQYARHRDREQGEPPDQTSVKKIIFLGSKPIIDVDKNRVTLSWRWKLGDQQLIIDAGLSPEGKLSAAKKTAALLEKSSRPGETGEADFYSELENIFGKQKKHPLWKTLRAGGLISYRGESPYAYESTTKCTKDTKK